MARTKTSTEVATKVRKNDRNFEYQRRSIKGCDQSGKEGRPVNWAREKPPRTLLNAQVANKKKVALEISFKARQVGKTPSDVLIAVLNRRPRYIEHDKPE